MRCRQSLFFDLLAGNYYNFFPIYRLKSLKKISQLRTLVFARTPLHLYVVHRVKNLSICCMAIMTGRPVQESMGRHTDFV